MTKKPKKPGFYWYKKPGGDWTPVEVAEFGYPEGFVVLTPGQGVWDFLKECKGEWGEEIVHRD